jgi:trimethylamine:corrinoid methyltransferase-like protein
MGDHNVEEKERRYGTMKDHDILVKLGVKMETTEEHLAELNNSVSKHRDRIEQNTQDVDTMIAICKERSKSLFNRIEAVENAGVFDKKKIAGLVAFGSSFIYILYELVRRL